MEIKVNLKKMGKRKNSIEEAVYRLDKEPHNVRDLIEQIVNTCVKDYNARQENGELLATLTQQEIEDKSSAGKVSFGVNYGEKPADFEKAAATAVQAFEDGIYRIFLDENQLDSLYEKIEISDESRLTFVRLTMLAGRMW